jgi:hypothetical protein
VDTSIPGKAIPPGEVQSPITPPGAQPLSQSNVPTTIGLVGTEDYVWKNRKAGDRIRFVLSWNACAQATLAPNRIGVDFDVFLYNATQKRYLYASQSNDDNNEGFDIIVPPNGAGDYVVYVTHMNDAKGCSDSPNKETYTWATYQ